MNPWPMEKEAQLRDLWGKFTAAQIAELMGLPSRNAVIGKARRLHLVSLRKIPQIAKGPRSIRQPPANRSPEHQRDVEERRRKRKSAAAAVIVVKKRRNPTFNPTPPATVEAFPEPKSLRIYFHKRTESQCSWIEGEPAWKAECCGHPVQPGSSYCPHHHQRVWTKVEVRKR